MKYTILTILALCASPAALIAPIPAASAQAQSSFTIDSPIEALMANPKAREVIDRELPDLDKHPMYETFKAMSLVELQALSAGQISEEKVAAIKAALDKARSTK